MPIPYHVWSPFSTILLDPFVLFCLGCLVTPLIVESTYNEDVALCDVSLRGFNDQTAGLWKAYWTDTAVLCAAAYAVVAVLIASDYPALPGSDTSAANWFLANGAIIHVAMDGLTGGFEFLPMMSENYKKLDNRALGFGNDAKGLTDDAVAVATVVFRAELFVMAPLCFLTYIAYYSRSKYCPALALVTLSAQLWGTVMFVGPELMTGCKNMVPIGMEGCSAGFSRYELLYFWFAVGANFVPPPVKMDCLSLCVSVCLCVTHVLAGAGMDHRAPADDGQHRRGHGVNFAAGRRPADSRSQHSIGARPRVASTRVRLGHPGRSSCEPAARHRH